MAKTSRRKKVLVVGGSVWQVALVRAAKKRGCFVICTNPYKDSPGFAPADVGLRIDIRHMDKLLATARRYRVDAVVSDQIDLAVPTVAYLAEKLGLPGIGRDKAALFTNKHLMREFCDAHGFLQPRSRLVSSPQEAGRAAREFGFPCIMKPLDSRSSRGVFLVRNAAQLKKLIPLTLSEGTNRRDFLVEERIVGLEHTVEGFKLPDGHVTLAVSTKGHYAGAPTVADRLVYSGVGSRYAALARSHDALIDAMGLPFGITHCEYMLKGGRFYMIEVAARGGGVGISSEIIPIISGADVTQALVRLSLGEDLRRLPIRAPKAKHAVLEFFETKKGRVKALHGLEKIRAMPQIHRCELNIKVGDRVGPPANDSARPGYFIGMAGGLAGIDRLSRRVKRTLRIDYE